MPEPERAFDYPEPPERKMLFSELLEKCGYEEEVIDQYTDVGDTEVQSPFCICSFKSAFAALHIVFFANIYVSWTE